MLVEFSLAKTNGFGMSLTVEKLFSKLGWNYPAIAKGIPGAFDEGSARL